MEPQLIADYRCGCGEGPLWHPNEQCLYWIDIDDGRMFRYNPSSGEHEQVYEGDVIGGTTLQADGDLLLFMDRGAVCTWRDGEINAIIEEIPEERETRFNDVIPDPAGRVFCGTMPTQDRLGRLYRLDRDITLTILLEGIGTSNGLGFTPDNEQMYYVDSPKHEVYMFDYDRDSGEIGNQRVFVKTPDDEGVPDGMTVDAEGYVWVAKWDGGCLVRYSPVGEEERRISFPARKVSSVTFGGPDYTDIFVTTAGGKDKPNEGEGAGALFHLSLGIQGVPEFRSMIGH